MIETNVCSKRGQYQCKFLGPSQEKSRCPLLSIVVIPACSITSLDKKSNGKRGGNSSSSLAISSVGPDSGPTAGGITVTITGKGFTHSTSVALCGAASPAVTYASSSKLQATSPPHASETVSVAVTENPHNQSAPLAGRFTYSNSLSISSPSPSQGPTSSGTVVTINSTGFQKAATVTLGNLQSSRSFTSGAPNSRLNSTLISGTSFTDDNVQPGDTDFYVTTAVNSSDVEGRYSNEAEAIVPSP